MRTNVRYPRMRLAPVLLLFLLGVPAFSQDTLFYVRGGYVTGQVEEIGVDRVRYRTQSGENAVTVVAEKSDLLRVKLAQGQEFIFAAASAGRPASEEFLSRTRVISLDVLAPALNHIVVGYEQAIGGRMILCAKAGYIGFWPLDEYADDPRGSAVRFEGPIGAGG